MDGSRLQQQSLPLLLVEREWDSPNAIVYMRCISHKFNKLLKDCWLHKAKQRLKKSKTHQGGSKSDKYFAEEKKWWLFTVLYLAASYLTELRQINEMENLRELKLFVSLPSNLFTNRFNKTTLFICKTPKCFSKSEFVWKIWISVEQKLRKG